MDTVTEEITMKPGYHQTVGEVYTGNRYTKEEMRAFARDIQAGRIFTSGQVAYPSDVPLVFMPFGLMGPEAAKQFEAEGNIILWEYLHAAGPRGVNGYPMFFSCRMFNLHEWKYVASHHDKIVDALNALESEG